MPQGRFKKSTVTVAAVIISLFTVLAVTALIFLLKGSNGPFVDGQAVVYKKNDGAYLYAAGETVKLKVGDDYSALITKDGKYLIYTTPSPKVSKKYDIYMCGISSSAAVKKGSTLIDYGVERNFEYNDEVLYYSKQDARTLAVTTYRYDLEKNKKTDIDFGIKNLYVPSNSQTVFYTKEFVDSEALYSYSLEEGSKELIKPVADVHFYDNGKTAELLFETGSYNEGEAELYRVVPGANPVQIATMVSDVLYDEYSAGGNLYYLTKKDTPTDWRGIIEDDLEDSDKAFKEPDKSDYTFIFGISIQYRLDMEKYQRKLLRDSIRKYLDTEVAEDLLCESYNLYVRNNDISKKMADGVEKDNIFAVSATGVPRVVFTSTQITKSDMKISDFSDLADSADFENIKPAVDEIIAKCVKKTGTLYIDANITHPVELSSYDGKKAEFLFLEKADMFYVKVFEQSEDKFTLYKQTVFGKKAAQPEQIASSVINCKMLDDELWYQKNDSSLSSGDLYRCRQGESEKIEEKISSFAVSWDNRIVFFKNFESKDGFKLADFYIYNGKKASKISESVNVTGIEYGEAGAAFIRGKEDGELCIYSKNKLAEIDSGVYTILAY